MSISFSFKAKTQSSRIRKTSDDATTDSSNRNYVVEFNSADAPPSPDSKIKPIAPIPNKDWRSNKKLKNLPNLPPLSQSSGDDSSSLQFVLDTGSNPETTDDSMGYGLNLRQPSENGSGGVQARDRTETLSDFELRRLKEDLESLPEGTTKEDFDEVPVDGFGASLLAGYGWKEGRGIGRNAKEDYKVPEVKRNIGRGGLGFTDELPDYRNAGGEDNGGRKEKENSGLALGKEVRIVNGRDMGMKGKIVDVKSGGDILVLKLSRSNEKVKVRSSDVADLGSFDEEQCLRKLKELKVKKSKAVDKGRNVSKKRGGEEERVNWLRNHIRVKIISQELKGGRLYLKKGVVVDVVGPGLCDVMIDESREMIQGVDQEMLETALPKRGGPVLVLYGRQKGVYGSLVERDSEKEMGVVRDADTHETFSVKLDQIAEYVGEPSEIGY
ncbi:hypothetical protein CASFOL_041895 [Castilleja foliolosa]|uniref:G-patch domain-containing protein n=1 Tax=Castilleja foliolosa TaxID=1961234 RepID=A0ABD3B8Z1_9LAMI